LRQTADSCCIQSWPQTLQQQHDCLPACLHVRRPDTNLAVSGDN
jgi:hypothetical protein